MVTQRRRGSVLAKSNAEVAEELRDDPGRWFVVAADDDPGQAHTYSQTAYRIRMNYQNGQGLAAFVGDETGRFEAITSRRHAVVEGKLKECAIHARWVPTEQAAAG